MGRFIKGIVFVFYGRVEKKKIYLLINKYLLNFVLGRRGIEGKM